MKEELRRIKQKDYSAIDQKLFDNMIRTDNLSSTLSHLTEFQQFLMNQINVMNNPDKKSASASLKSSITKNFDTLRQSLVQCSRIVSQSDSALPSSSFALKKNMAFLQAQLSHVKEEFKSLLEKRCLETKKQTEWAMNQLIMAFEKERSMKKSFQSRVLLLQKEKEALIQANKELRRGMEAMHSERKQRPNTSDSRVFGSANTSKYLMREEEEAREESIGPLRQRAVNNNTLYTVPSFSEKDWRIVRSDGQARYSTAQRKSSQPLRRSLTRQPSNHRLSQKENPSSFRQQQALLSKGVREERKMSKQKLKIFSLM